MADPAKADAIGEAIQTRDPSAALRGRELALMQYTEKLTLRPGEMAEGDIHALREAGLDDGEILEANQIIGYFNYVNRCLNGLGVTTEGATSSAITQKRTERVLTQCLVRGRVEQRHRPRADGRDHPWPEDRFLPPGRRLTGCPRERMPGTENRHRRKERWATPSSAGITA